MRKLTPEQAVEVAELREKGWSYARIGARFGVSDGAVHYQCLKQGAISPRTRAIRKPGPGTLHSSDGRPQRRFTDAEDARMLALEAQGQSSSVIARTMGRPYTSIRLRLMALHLRTAGYANG